MSTKLLLAALLFSSTASCQEDTTAFIAPTIEPIISLDFPGMHGGYKDLTPGRYVDSIPFEKENILGGWYRVVSSGYYTPNGDAMWEPNEVHGSIYFSENKVYYMTYPIRMHSYADYHVDESDQIILSNQEVLPDSLGWFGESSNLFTKDSLSILYFDGHYYRREEMDSEIVLELEQKTMRPEGIAGKWVKTDTLSCCYGETWWQEYPWDMPENLNISMKRANVIVKDQMIHFTINGVQRSFFIAVLGEYEMELEAGSWFKGEADRVVYHRRWDY